MCCCYWEIVAHVVLSFFCCVSCALTLDGVYVTTHSTNIAVIFHQTEWGSQEKGIFAWTFGRKGFHKTAEGRDTGFLGCERITMRPGDFETEQFTSDTILFMNLTGRLHGNELDVQW
jgi:hypothetical protein